MSGCTSAGSLIVEVRTDYVAGVDFEVVQTTLSVEGVETVREQRELAADLASTPGRVAEIDPLPLGSHEVTVRLVDAMGATVASQPVLVDVRGPRAVTVVITRRCRALHCPEDGDDPRATACVSGECVPPECAQDDADASCPSRCSADDDCEPTSDCARARCEAGACFVRPDDSLCRPGAACDVELGCPRECEAEDDCDPPELGAWSDCGGFGGSCDTAGSRSREVTRHRCDEGVCVVANSTQTEACVRDAEGVECDDGVFCNGPDACAGGACVPGASDPCPGMSVCDEAADACTGCSVDADCPPPTMTTFGPCGGFSDACDTSGTQSRDVTTYRCVAGTCEPTVTPEPRSCSRTTDEDPCDDGDICNGADTCRGGVCTNTGPSLSDESSCGDDRYRCCGGRCRNTYADANHCGGCGIVCPGVCRVTASGSRNYGVCRGCSTTGCPAGSGWRCRTFICPNPPCDMCGCEGDSSLCQNPGIRTCEQPGGAGGLWVCSAR